MTTTAIAPTTEAPAEAPASRRTIGGDKPSPVVTAAKSEALYKIIEMSAGITGVSRLTIEELSKQSGMPHSTTRRHLRKLVAAGRIVRLVGVNAKAAESDGERALRVAGGVPTKSYFQPALTAPVAGNPEAVARVRSERQKLARKAARRAAQKQARAEHANRVAGAA